MGSFKRQPSANAGFWSLNGNDVEIHDLQLGRTHEYTLFVPWSAKITLVCDHVFTAKAEATAFRAETLTLARIRAIESSEYDVESDVPQWTKHHAEPHPEAKHSDYPWGSPMTFKA